MNLRELIGQFAGAYNGMVRYVEQKEAMGIKEPKNCVIWMIDEEGAHVIDADVLMNAMDTFLTTIETHDKIMKVEYNEEVQTKSTEENQAEERQTEPPSST